ncbi:Uncharacterised protein [Neisseria gonorrhoeae]|uniref:Uncharacterized protein n=1 Tax=Neisseria gonorrhoeae TaxID=485 RepID=A0A378W0P2_NEIGO|nr:Uncharacterised protein [Neisseria gonorrhoeae]
MLGNLPPLFLMPRINHVKLPVRKSIPPSEQFQIGVGTLCPAAAQLYRQTQIMCGIGIFQGILQGNLAFFIQLVKVLVEGLHTQGSGFFITSLISWMLPL